MPNKNEPLKSCKLCPRVCGIDRTSGKIGVCGENATVRISRASLHMWEEPCISGEKGSGTVFFTGCPLHCVFCQNRAISGGENGVSVTEKELADVFLRLQDMGALNINLVTPTHFVPYIVSALEKAKTCGLCIPVIYNTGSYECVETLKMLSGLVDIYLPDLKYFSSELSLRYSHAPDYFEIATRAIDEMVRQVGRFEFSRTSADCCDYITHADSENDDELAFSEIKKGVVVRHLILPGFTEDSKKIISYLYNKYGDDILISIMNQFTPLPGLSEYPEINHRVTAKEYDEVIDYALSIGVTNAFIQDEGTAEESFIPDFYNFDLKKFLGQSKK